MTSKKIQNYRTRVVERKRLKLKIKHGDKVIVVCGDDKGKQGEVVLILRKVMRVLIKGINLHKKVVTGEGGVRRFETVEMPIHISNVKKV
ncbi:MAG: 50S ribosomal protein L24 [Alphaproteobacteria bacterium]|nr:50S ribosomal protein L24 [Rickettsiales bacterium]